MPLLLEHGLPLAHRPPCAPVWPGGRACMQARRTCQPRRAAAASRESATAGSGSVTDSLELLDSLLGSVELGKCCWPDASLLLLWCDLRANPELHVLQRLAARTQRAQ
jgi:hypothetical protein